MQNWASTLQKASHSRQRLVSYSAAGVQFDLPGVRPGGSSPIAPFDYGERCPLAVIIEPYAAISGLYSPYG